LAGCAGCGASRRSASVPSARCPRHGVGAVPYISCISPSSTDPIAVKSTVSSSLRTDAHREIRAARSSGEWVASGVAVPLKARKSPFGSKPMPNQRPSAVSMCAMRWHCATGVTSRVVVWPKPGTWMPIHRPAGWETAWRCSGFGYSLHENSTSVAVAVMASSPVSRAQVPTITRPAGVQRIRPAMVCVQVELSWCTERLQVESTRFHLPLVEYGGAWGSPEIGDEAPESLVLI